MLVLSLISEEYFLKKMTGVRLPPCYITASFNNTMSAWELVVVLKSKYFPVPAWRTFSAVYDFESSFVVFFISYFCQVFLLGDLSELQSSAK